MSEMGAACVASAGAGFTKGTAASMTMYPVVPDYDRFPGTAAASTETTGEIGLAGPLDEAPAPPHVHLQGQGQAGLVVHPRVTPAPTTPPRSA